jgi:ribosomal protein S18 acetylase RimI-like enzyme
VPYIDGFVLAVPKKNLPAYRRMSVAAAYRREGRARAMVSELVRRAREHQLVEVLVRADTPWTSAVELYRACGFEITGADETDTRFRLRL